MTSSDDHSGILFLLREDHSEQGRILGRTLLVDCMRLFYFHENSDRLELMRIAFELASLRQERLLVTEHEKHAGSSKEVDEALAEAERQKTELRAEANALGCKDKELDDLVLIFDKTEALFKATPQPEGYFIFRHASHSAHTSRVALEATKVYADDGTVQISFGGSPGNVLRVGIQAAQVFLIGYRSVVELLDWDTIGAVQSFHHHAYEQLTQLADDAEIGGIDEFLADKGIEPIEEGSTGDPIRGGDS